MIKLYVDVLFVTNLAVCIVLVSAAASFLHISVSVPRTFAAAAIGALSSLSVLTGSMAAATVIKIMASVIVCAVAFNTASPRKLFKRIFAYLAAYMTFLAAVYIIWYITGCGRIYIIYGTVYFDVSIITLVFSCIACYTLVSVAERIYTEHIYNNTAYKLFFKINDKSYAFEALADTGNMARDHLSGTPVIVCVSDKMCSDWELAQTLPRGFRLMPYSTVSGDSLMWLAKPQELRICDGKGNTKPLKATIGIVEGSSEQAIFNPCLLR